MFQKKSEPVIPLTKEAFAQKIAERDRLMGQRKEVIERLKVAREMGDLSENGAYTAAKFELGSIGRQLRQLNYVLSQAYVAAAQSDGVAGFGKTVVLKNQTKTMTFMLVSQHESNPVQNKLSLESPIGKAVVGKSVGAEIVVVTPVGEQHFTLVEIK